MMYSLIRGGETVQSGTHPYDAIATFQEGDSVRVVESTGKTHRFTSKGEIEGYITGQERVAAWKDKPRGTAWDPDHYKGYIGDLQWIEAMSYLYTADEFKAILSCFARKYMDRCGKKDDPLQEYKKALVYLQYLIDFMESGCKSGTKIRKTD